VQSWRDFNDPHFARRPSIFTSGKFAEWPAIPTFCSIYYSTSRTAKRFSSPARTT
jgi:hypothetical protein